MKIDTIIITHAGLAEAFAEAAEMIMGPLPNLKAVAFREGDDMLRTGDQLADMLRKSEADFCIILTDLYGATPSNAASYAVSQCENAAVITGANLMAVIQAAELDGEDIGIEAALELISAEAGNNMRVITREMILSSSP